LIPFRRASEPTSVEFGMRLRLGLRCKLHSSVCRREDPTRLGFFSLRCYAWESEINVRDLSATRWKSEGVLVIKVLGLTPAVGHASVLHGTMYRCARPLYDTVLQSLCLIFSLIQRDRLKIVINSYLPRFTVSLNLLGTRNLGS